MISALLLAGAQVGSGAAIGGKLPPASEAAVLAGAKACIGATVDPAGQDQRLAGWFPAVATDAGKGPGGVARRVAVRDGVRLTVATGIDGGCVVDAKADTTFDRAQFYADLAALLGVPVDATKPTVGLPNGETMVVQVNVGKRATYVELVLANPSGKYAKNEGK